jgi:hypothetical protein
MLKRKKCKNCDKPRTTGKFCSTECRKKWMQQHNQPNPLNQLRKIDETKRIPCDRCKEFMPAWYTLSLLTKGLWIRCNNCGTHAAPYQPDLDIPERPSKHYLRNNGEASKARMHREVNKKAKKEKTSLPQIVMKIVIPNYDKEEVMKTRGASLTPEQKIALGKRNTHIRELKRKGYTYAQIAAHYDLAKMTVKDIVSPVE